MKVHWQILVALGLGIKRHWHIIFALVAGLVMGLVVQTLPNKELLINILGFVGQVFIRLIQMVVIPLVASAIIVGISSLGDNKQLSKIGVKMVVYYAFITVVAVIIGLSLALIIQPGHRIQGFVNHQQAVEVQHQVQMLQADKSNLSEIYLNMIPNATSIAKGEFAPILLLVVIFALALASIGEINRPVVSFFESIFAATMKITDWIMWAATPGIFALTAYSVASSGIKVFADTRFYILAVVLGLLIQLLVVYPLMLRIFSKVSFKSLYKAVAEAMMVAFGTASSSATLPVTIACCERRAGISSKICSFVLPLGATMNMDGTAMFQSIAVLTICQAYGADLSLFQIIQVGILAIVSSSAAGGIPSGGWITIILILSGIGLSLNQVGQVFTYLFAIDRIIDMVRTVLNVTSDTVVASIIASNEGELDYELLGNQEVWKEVV
jgi:DAACS family dicarboxylate/amino acid:cation (Na+ or H+) symporter